MLYFIINDLESVLPSVDFTNFTEFELLATKIFINIYVLIFLILIISIVFRILVRMR